MIPQLEQALKETSLELKDFDEVVCGKGPGSYTGVRIALTIAKTLCTCAPHCKLKLMSSLMMFGNINQKFIALMNARSSRSYIGVYNQEQVILADQIMTNDQVKTYIAEHPDYLLIGDCAYLGIDAQKPNLVEGMNSRRDLVENLKDIDLAKPVYLKD
jgi:tRNA threonylcarbamoyl adenosine modification protein YeaZ